MIKKIIQRVFAGAVALLLVWIAFSYIDIISDNTTAEPAHSKYNIFVLMNGGSEATR
jgi:hypothetical protein